MQDEAPEPELDEDPDIAAILAEVDSLVVLDLAVGEGNSDG